MDEPQPSTPRGRPKSIDRAHVVTVAMDQYWRSGTDAVSLNEVCRQAEVSKPALYREFGGEDGLMDAALEFYAENYLRLMLDVAARDAPFADVIQALVDVITTPNEDLPAGCLLAKMRVMSTDLGRETQARVAALRAESRSIYASLVERALAAGEIRNDLPVEIIAAFLDAQLTALLMQVALGEDSPEDLRAQSRLTFAGLAP